jgi:hypothetical protein
MADLSSYINVFNTALVIIEHKGWALRFDKTQDFWFAKKNGWELLADNPIELLGLVAIHEHHSPKEKIEYWWKIDEPSLLEKFVPEIEN